MIQQDPRRMSEEKKVDWVAVGAIATLVGLVIAYAIYLDQKTKHEEEKAQEKAKLVAPAPRPREPDDVVPAAEYMPWGPNLPTPIPLRNDGKQEALIKQVILSKGKWVPTPHRPNIMGAGKTIRVLFEPRHYVKAVQEYVLVMKNPSPAPGGGQWTTLEIALIDPDHVGKTFIGTVTVIFDGLEQMHFPGVQLDALSRAPEAEIR